MERYLVTRERKILRKMYGPTYENGYWRGSLLINLNIRVLLLQPQYIDKHGLGYCKNGWRQDCRTLLDGKQGRGTKKKDQD
jgi:hypothetical protein